MGLRELQRYGIFSGFQNLIQLNNKKTMILKD